MNGDPIVIVGAGPAGLVLALSLARYEIHSVILEKEINIGDDPRGVYLAGDAVRILYQLGIGDQMKFIGHELENVNFHRSSFQNRAFLSIDLTADWLHQVVPGGILQIQPRLESILQAAAEKSAYCDLRRGCCVIARKEGQDGVTITYEKRDGTNQDIQASWLVGADGKTGVVRKRFLEPAAGIKQEVSLFPYVGTWIAANLLITLPTPESHPQLCFWGMGMTPEEVYDLFWPAGWRFSSPPGKATACGRFGPREARLWRHEFAEPDWNDLKDPTALLWEHLTPLISRTFDSRGRFFPTGAVTFPRECIEIRRCRPFTFCQKVVNKWFHNRTIIIGDAAHVFPPFGGQGIACGIRDGDSLAWRLAMLTRLPVAPKSLTDQILHIWSLERRQGVDDSIRLTMKNGMLCSGNENYVSFIIRIGAPLLARIPCLPSISQIATAHEKEGYKATKDGFFLRSYGGGGKLSQIFVKDLGSPILSDHLLQHGPTLLTLLILDPSSHSEIEEVRRILEQCQTPTLLLSTQSITLLSSDSQQPGTTGMKGIKSYRPCLGAETIVLGALPGYSVREYFKRLGRGAKYAIIRPDLIIFAAAKTPVELQKCLGLLNKMLAPT